MESCAFRSDHNLKILPPLPFTPLDTPDVMDANSAELPLIGGKLPPARTSWSAEAADFFVLLCSLLLTTVSIYFVALVFYEQAGAYFGSSIPNKTFSTLQRIISTLSVAITSAVIMVAGKRYVLFKLAREGLRSRRVAIYSHPSIGNLTTYLVLHGAELPMLALSAVWGLALITGLTVNSTWEMASVSSAMDIQVPSGPFNAATPNSSWFLPASEQLAFVMSSLCFGAAGTAGLINITRTNVDTAMGIIYYPPLQNAVQNVGFSVSTTMNGFNISMDGLSSVPSTARNLVCVNSSSADLELWLDGSDDQTLSVVVAYPSAPSFLSPVYRFNATAIIMGGTLSSSGSYTQFEPNGTSWPNVMSAGSQWAQDITSLICNTTSPSISTCHGSFFDFATELNTKYGSEDPQYRYWSTILGMALGAYTFGMSSALGGETLDVPITVYKALFTSRYGIYILILNIIVSGAMLIIVVGLRLTSHLGADFMNSTRLLLDPLKKPELFNASLDTTVGALADPYMLVRGDNTFLLAEQKSTRKRAMRIRWSAVRRRWPNPVDRIV